MTEFADDGYCFVCGPNNAIGLKLDFSYEGRTITTEFIPQKVHQGYRNIVHGGIISTLLDEVMVKLAIEMGMPAVTAHMDIRLRKAVAIGKKITFTAEIRESTRKLIIAYAKAETDDGIAADATGKLIRIELETD
ncbi:MAG: hypothetical protein AMK71_09035 [Nitrospira bacterium SG8_35_4]|nr:MAG: hypothetical protein AMK71_09035 [Nitrospira bacterium SG8_35_4]